jgi:hypothetical protein
MATSQPGAAAGQSGVVRRRSSALKLGLIVLGVAVCLVQFANICKRERGDFPNRRTASRTNPTPDTSPASRRQNANPFALPSMALLVENAGP